MTFNFTTNQLNKVFSDMFFIYFIVLFGRYKFPEWKASWNIRNVELNMQVCCEHRPTTFNIFQPKHKLTEHSSTKMYDDRRVKEYKHTLKLRFRKVGNKICRVTHS